MMTNRKQRPTDGPGANGLRGGTNLYSTKTKIGRWQDDIGGPAAFKMGFHTSAFETEAQNQQLGATLLKPRFYGSELPDIRDPSKNSPSVWETTAKQMSEGNQKIVDDLQTSTSMEISRLEEYRKAWTTDVPVSRNMRFQTESRRAGSCIPEKYQVPILRALPGTPRALEYFRERLIERHGILAMSALRHHIGKGSLHREEFVASVAGVEVKMDRSELNQVWAYSSNFTADEFVGAVIGRYDEFDDEKESSKFYSDRIFSLAGSAVTPHEFITILNDADHPEVVKGLGMYIRAYFKGFGGCIGRAGIAQLLIDLHVSAPLEYEGVMESLFP